MAEAENAVRKQPKPKRKPGGRPWKPGQSGNPAGKPPGTRARATRLVEAMLDGQAAAIVQSLVDMAIAGDAVAMRLCVERLAPAPRDRRVELPLPQDLSQAEALVEAERITIQEMAAGRISPMEASVILGTIRKHREPLAIVGEGAHEGVYPIELRLAADADPDLSMVSMEVSDGAAVPTQGVAPAHTDGGGAGGAGGPVSGGDWPGLPPVSQRGLEVHPAVCPADGGGTPGGGPDVRCPRPGRN